MLDLQVGRVYVGAHLQSDCGAVDLISASVVLHFRRR